MQEEVNQRTVALTVKAAKLTGRVLLAAIQKYLAQLKKLREDIRERTPHKERAREAAHEDR